MCDSWKCPGCGTLVVNAEMRNWVFVKVITDQPGLFGWGEATLEWHTRGVVGAGLPPAGSTVIPNCWYSFTGASASISSTPYPS